MPDDFFENAGSIISATTIDIHIGLRLQARRSVFGYSQQQLADVMGVTLRGVQKYENGEIHFSVASLVELSRVLLVEISYFLDEVLFFIPANRSDGVTSIVDKPKEGCEEIALALECFELVKAFQSIKDQTIRSRMLKLIGSVAAVEKEVKVGKVGTPQARH